MTSINRIFLTCSSSSTNEQDNRKKKKIYADELRFEPRRNLIRNSKVSLTGEMHRQVHSSSLIKYERKNRQNLLEMNDDLDDDASSSSSFFC